MAELFSLDMEKANTLQILCYDLVYHVECPAITVKPFPPTMPLSRQVQRNRPVPVQFKAAVVHCHHSSNDTWIIPELHNVKPTTLFTQYHYIGSTYNGNIGHIERPYVIQCQISITIKKLAQPRRKMCG